MTAYLLDTHAILWWFSDSDRLSPSTRALLADPENEFLASAASAWEVTTKARIGRLSEFPMILRDYPTLLVRNGFRDLPVSGRHGLFAGSIDHPHRDPFDRMIAAQSVLENLPVLSTDPALTALGATTIW
ncbi:MAG: type II toxin-antitoxin system VapC family toxin [Actinobacteria bacterium]|nr:type II toxin-antitoxin system VapC family toxin [Actinomycetota bacterium]